MSCKADAHIGKRDGDQAAEKDHQQAGGKTVPQRFTKKRPAREIREVNQSEAALTVRDRDPQHPRDRHEYEKRKQRQQGRQDGRLAPIQNHTRGENGRGLSLGHRQSLALY
jgi:hypothetical protein